MNTYKQKVFTNNRKYRMYKINKLMQIKRIILCCKQLISVHLSTPE